MNDQKLRDDAAYKEWRDERVTPDAYSAWHAGAAFARLQLGKRIVAAVADLMSDDGENGGWERSMNALANIAGTEIPALKAKADLVDIRDVIGGKA